MTSHMQITLHNFIIGLLFFFLVSCGNNEQAQPEMEREDQTTLTVMSYNIQHGRGMDGEIDLERIAQVILDEGADIVALQEVDMGVERSGRIDIATELAELTGLEHYVFGKNIDHQGGDYGNATLSRFPITEYENVHFEQMSPEQRGILTTLIDVDGFSLLMMNTHLAHRSQDEPERVIFIEGARDEIIPRYQSDAIIFIGDFNDVPGSATHEAVKEYLTDVWEVVGDGDGFTIPPDNPNRRIDYIFYDDGLEPLNAWVPVTMASDHLPLVADFVLRN
ncbi:MAG: endonuclease/exonuclease/phosphatase family protein [Balneolaceae bacterium]|jgi:endonuclease/exonuclease/phosphatase family metal-dependent hydrolase|nr:endonuclease/exonuclease/phosphatase family protein [Balneolaceae bacterium]